MLTWMEVIAVKQKKKDLVRIIKLPKVKLTMELVMVWTLIDKADVANQNIHHALIQMGALIIQVQ